MNILVIDDDPAVRDAFELSLSPAHQVRTASGGAEGIAEAQRAAPELVFLDLRMPEMGGIESLRRLRSAGVTCPVYIVTAFVHEFTRELQSARNEGLDFQVASKPLVPSQIRQIVSAAGLL